MRGAHVPPLVAVVVGALRPRVAVVVRRLVEVEASPLRLAEAQLEVCQPLALT